MRWPCGEDKEHQTRILAFLVVLTIQLSISIFVAQGSSNDFIIKIDLPSDVVYDVTVTDSLPWGLIYDPSSLSISGASIINPEEKIDGPGDVSQPSKITWNFGQIDNTAGQDITMRFSTIVADITSNENGAILAPSNACLSWKDSRKIVHSYSGESRPIKIVEPDLQISRSFSPSGGWHGDLVTCLLHVSHSPSSTADAYDAILQESLPSGLSYVPDSMQIVKGPSGSMNYSDGPSWQFSQIDQSWDGDNEIELKYQATIDKRVRSDANLTAFAALSWTSTPGDNPVERSYSRASAGQIKLTPPPPAFNLTMADYPTTVSPGGELTYAISYKNSGGDALRAALRASYDANTEFVSADPAPDEGTTNSWTLGEDGLLLSNASGTIKVIMRVNSTLADGTLLAGSAVISCQQGASAHDSVFTKVLASTPSLLIEKTASDAVIRPGGSLDYQISYTNVGNDVAKNVTITDVVDSNLLFDPANSSPQPSLVWQEEDGTHLLWNASVLNLERMQPGDSGTISLQVSLPSVPQHPDYDWVYNLYKIDCNESQGRFMTLETAVIHSLYIRKKVEAVAYGTGEMVNYTLYYGNDLVVDLTDTTITDIMPDARYMEYEGAEPAPSSVQGNVITWNIGDLPAKSSGVIHLYASTVFNRSTINYYSSGRVSGQGFVNFDQRLDTAEEPSRLTNYANITARVKENLDIVEHDSSSASLILSESFGTALRIAGHGSGSYTREEESLMRSRNKTIEAKTSLDEQYQSTSFSLPQGRSISYDSKWSEAQSARNRVTGATLSEEYRYASRIDRESTVQLDKNGTTLDSQTSFEGKGHVGLQKLAGDNSTYYDKQGLAAHDRDAPAFVSEEDYLGSFSVTTHFDEYGKNAETFRSVSGEGYAASDKRLGTSQGSYESGTGNYSAEDRVQTVTNYLEKDINVTYGPMNYSYTSDANVQLSQKWSEGMWSRTGLYYPGSSKGRTSTESDSFIGERFSSLDYLNKSTVASGLGLMKTEADFQGKAEFKVEMNASSNESSPEIALYEEYIGKYSLKRNAELGIARFNEPHLSVSKAGKAEPAEGTFIDYVITVTNDGNRALGPVYVQDLFPPGAEYVRSSLRPTVLNSSSARWTLLSLGIGSTTTIELKLNMTGDASSVVNRVQVDGSYDGGWVTAQNYSSLEFNWLSCCPPEIWADMTARADAEDAMRIHYSITLKNRGNSVMAATITDHLPADLMFQNSSIAPASYSPGQVIWNIVDLQPGETRTIDYLALASHSGSFVNQAHIEAYPLDGSGGALADVATRVDVGGTIGDFSSSDWQPPACFGLNCTEQDLGDDWMPCDTCGISENELSLTSCATCA